MPFAREEDGRISLRFFGAHTWRRTAFAGDYTGLEIQRTLVNRTTQLQVPILDRVYVTKLLVKDNGCARSKPSTGPSCSSPGTAPMVNGSWNPTKVNNTEVV
jgi:succinate dehydrogenase/fumarate reductase flavoprotein subunit